MEEMTYWPDLISRLEAGEEPPEDLIDEATARILDGTPKLDAVPFLKKALQVGKADITLRSVAFSLATVCEDDDTEAVDTLVSYYKGLEDNPFLASQILAALGFLAMRSRIARAETLSIVQRFSGNEDEFVLVSACKVCSKLCLLYPSKDVLDIIERLSKSDQVRVQAEARHQAASCQLGTLIHATNAEEFHDTLVQVRAAFARAEASEEMRPDSHSLTLILDMFLAFKQMRQGFDIVPDLESLSERLATSLGSAGLGSYGSPQQDAFAVWALDIASSLLDAARAIGRSDEWRNFDEALVGLGALWVIASRDEEENSASQYGELGAIVRRVFSDGAAPLLNRAVGRTRFRGAIVEYEFRNGEDGISAGMRALAQAADGVEFQECSIVSEEALDKIQRISEGLGRKPEELLPELLSSVEKGDLPFFARTLGLTNKLLPIDNPELYGGDPNVDATVRKVLKSARRFLKEYPGAGWNHFIQVLVAIVQFSRNVRDDLPEFSRSKESKGLGQDASERHLQDALFEKLRDRFGRGAIYEGAKIAGGRTDSGVTLGDFCFPIEVKHEFRDISPQHIESSFLTQVDIYATERDRIAFLVILDLRQSNDGTSSTKLYSLEEGFFVCSLEPDPQVPDSDRNALIVVLVPGNRPLPSATTQYSRRPGVKGKRPPSTAA